MRSPLLWTLLVVALAAIIPAPARAQTDGDRPAGEARYWVVFRDRAEDEAGRTAAPVAVSAEAIARRARRGDVADAARFDTPVARRYLAALRALGVEPLVESRWLNAVSARLTPAERAAVAAQAFVQEVRPVGRYLAAREDVAEDAAVWPLVDYGASAGQLRLVNADDALEAGYNGAGVRLGFLDTRFDFNHPALVHLPSSGRLVGTQNFAPADQSNFHGLNVTSIAAGYAPGQLVGAGHGAEVVAATTEYAPTETHAEEDYFVAGLEYLEASGVDVVNVSLGYFDFDPGQADYVFADMNGDTTPVTRAVDRAAALGVAVVISAGNEGGTAWNHITAPADADSALAVAAVRPDSVRASFSSPGPTADGRIKPDVAAQGTGIVYALSNGGYGFAGNGTSFSAPMVSGVVCQILQANPDLGPMQVFAILRETASRASNPDNQVGYGVVNAFAAVQRALATSNEPPPGDAGPGLVVRPTAVQSGAFVHATFEAGAGEPVEVALFDVLGRRAATLHTGTGGGGSATLLLALPRLTAGSYLLRLRAGDDVETRRIVVAR